MIKTKPDVSPNRLYNEIETAEALQIDLLKVTQYTAAGMIKYTDSRSTGQRLIKGSDIISFWEFVN